MNDVFDNNTVVVEVLVQVLPGAVPGSIHGINILTDHAMNGADASANLSILVGGLTPVLLQPVCCFWASSTLKFSLISLKLTLLNQLSHSLSYRKTDYILGMTILVTAFGYRSQSHVQWF